jgi:hypothetical protein
MSKYAPPPKGLAALDDPEAIVRQMLEGDDPHFIECAVEKVRRAAELYKKVSPESGGKFSRQAIAAIIVSIPVLKAGFVNAAGAKFLD